MGGGTFWRDGLHSCSAAIYTADHTKVTAFKSIVAHIISHLENPGALKMWMWSWQPLKHKTRACGNTNTSGDLQWSERLLFKTELMLLSRQFCMELNGLAVKLQAECKPETCTQVAILKTIMAMFCKRIQLQDEDNLKINSKLCRQSAL